jgi:hypothetical protein
VAGESGAGLLPLRTQPATGAGPGAGTGDLDGTVGAASPRLDSLEEKLASIERQFG